MAAAAVLGWAAITSGGGDRRPSPQEAGAAVPQPAPAALPAPPGPAPERLRVRVLGSFAHDRTVYTQGLEWDGDSLLESGGQYGRSLVRRWAPGEPRPRIERRLRAELFGEGLTVVGERVIQLTWREGVAIYRDRATLEEIERRRYEGEGWGLCWDGRRLFMSDGSDTLTLRDPATFAEIGSVVVRVGTVPVPGLNELECAEGWVYANLYETDEIARIDPSEGQVTALIDASGLLGEEERARGAEVLNGIAYDSETATFHLTGKLWPRVFEVVFEPAVTAATP